MKHAMFTTESRGLSVERCRRCPMVVRFRRADDGVVREWSRNQTRWHALSAGERPPECDASGAPQRDAPPERVEAVLSWFASGGHGVSECARQLGMRVNHVSEALAVLATRGAVRVTRVSRTASVEVEVVRDAAAGAP